MNSYYGQPPQREENNNLGTAIGLGLLGAGAAAAFGGPALLKNIKARRAKSQATGGPRGGQGGTTTRDNPTAAEVYGSLGTEAKPTKGQVYDRVNRQPRTDFEYQEYDFPLRKASQRQTVVDTDTGEIMARGGPTAYYQQFENVPTGNTQTPELYLSKFLDSYLKSLPTKQETTKGKSLAIVPKVKTAAYEEGSAVDKLMKSLLPEVNKEAGQMTATESSRQTRALAKQDDLATQEAARGILSELKEKQAVGTQVNPEKLARIEVNRNKDLQRIGGYMSNVIESVVDEDMYDTTPSAILQINNKAMEGTLSADDVAAFQQWSNTTFKNDPTVLSEINENIYGINDLLAPKVKQSVGEQLKSKGLGMAGMPGEGPLQIDVGMGLINIDSPAGVEILSNAGVTPEQATSYWIDKLKREGIIAEQPTTLVQVQESREPQVAVNAMETVNTADDQSDGRFLRNLQRNEDVNMAAVSEAVVDNKEAVLDSRISDALRYLRGKEIDTNFDYSTEEAIQARQVGQRFETLQSLGNQVIDEVQPGTPTTTTSAQRFFTNERDEIASLLGEQGISMTPGNIEKELALRLGSEAYKYGPKYTKRKQALQLGATYDPALFDNLAKESVVIAGENIPTGRVAETKISTTSMLGTPFQETVELGLREPTYMKETAERLKEKAEKKKDWLGSVRLEAASEKAPSNAELINTQRDLDSTLAYKGELENYLDSGRGSLSERTRAKQRLDDVIYELDRLDTKAEALTQQVYGGQSGARVRGAQKYTADYIQNLVSPSKLKSGIEEGQRLFYELNPETGEPIPGTQELRSERKMVDMTPKGGGGRNVAEFSAGNRDEGGGDIDVEDILRQARTPRDQSGRVYAKDQFGYRPGTGLTGKPLEGRPFTDDSTQTGRVITKTGIQPTKPQPSSFLDAKAINSFARLSDEQLGQVSMQGTEAEAYNADKMLAKRRSFDVAQDIRRIQNSGRPDAQKQVKSYLDELMANEIPGVDFS
jgi:hypothetical protein